MKPEEEPRIGVFVCHCGINIGGVVNVPAVKEYAATLPNVVHVDENLYTCSQDTQEKIKKAVKEHGLNRVIVASCSPRTHEPMFRETIREAGLNKYLFEMANIRDQCSWVHMRQKAEATQKAKDLVRMAVANARLNRSLGETAVPVVQPRPRHRRRRGRHDRGPADLPTRDLRSSSSKRRSGWAAISATSTGRSKERMCRPFSRT